ncbi:uncharacterized protein [Ptychodera flava]|uniref:uncharacterized protein n=1 Tax=Ptychodera flava TaxID=63121 RepID=UPI003969C0F0
MVANFYSYLCFMKRLLVVITAMCVFESLWFIPVTGTICNDECRFPVDGICDDGGIRSHTHECTYGSDCADCGEREESVCSDDCVFSGDDICDDGGPDSQYVLCYFGTDCGDCGVRVGRPEGPTGSTGPTSLTQSPSPSTSQQSTPTRTPYTSPAITPTTIYGSSSTQYTSAFAGMFPSYSKTF